MAKKLKLSQKAQRKVSISRVDGDIKQALKESLEKIGGLEKFVKKGENIFVKPNLTGDRDPSTGAVTNPQVTKALIELIYELHPKQVLLGDSPSWGFDTEEVYDITGCRNVAEETGCSLINLDTDERVLCRIKQARRLKKTYVAKSVLESDKLINVPVLKTHMQCGVTLGLKNMKGILPLKWKTKLHDLDPLKNYPGLDIGVADLHRLIQPDLTVMDGTICMEERGPLDGKPVGLGLIVTGANPVLVDSVCCKIMQFDPNKVGSIKLCAEIDSIDLNSYEIVGLSVESVTRKFEPCPTELYVGDNIQIKAGTVCSGCLATLNTAIDRLMQSQELDHIKELEIQVGKNIKEDPKANRVLYVGTCAIPPELTKAYREEKIVEGCPPTGNRIVQGIKQFE
jgi:uncharacterized protein (DUF362 family)